VHTNKASRSSLTRHSLAPYSSRSRLTLYLHLPFVSLFPIYPPASQPATLLLSTARSLGRRWWLESARKLREHHSFRALVCACTPAATSLHTLSPDCLTPECSPRLAFPSCGREWEEQQSVVSRAVVASNAQLLPAYGCMIGFQVRTPVPGYRPGVAPRPASRGGTLGGFRSFVASSMQLPPAEVEGGVTHAFPLVSLSKHAFPIRGRCYTEMPSGLVGRG